MATENNNNNTTEAIKESVVTLRKQIIQVIETAIVVQRLKMVRLGIISFGEGLKFSNQNAKIKSLYFNGQYWQVYAEEGDENALWMFLEDTALDDLIIIAEAIDSAEYLENAITRSKE